MTQWKPVAGYAGWYEVSDDGRVRSVDRWIDFADGRRRHYCGRELRQYVDEFGYRKVTLKRNSADLRVHVHVLVAAAYIGPRPDGLQVCHGDGNHLNNAPGNLRYDTPAGNSADTDKHGRRNPRRKLTDEAVAEIRRLRGVPLAHLALLFGTSRTHVCNIQLGNRR